MSNSDLLFSKRENGKIFLQEIFHAALRKCEKQLLLIKKEESPIIQKRILISSIYFSKLLLGRFLSLYRCYRSSKSHISTDVSKVDIENNFHQTITTMYNIYMSLKRGLSQYDPKMSRIVKFIDFQKPNACGSQLIALIQQDIPSNINIQFRGRKLKFYHKESLYYFSISALGPKKLFLSDLHIKWPKQIPKLPEKDVLFLAAQCQKILDTSDRFLVDIDSCIRSYYFNGELLRIAQIIHDNEFNFGYQTQASNSSIIISYPKTFSPRNIFKLATDGTKGVYLHSCCQICEISSDSDETNAKFLLRKVDGLNDQEIYDLIMHTHNLVHFSKIQSILKRFQDFFTSTSIASLKIVDDRQEIECYLYNVLAFTIGLDFITGDPIVFYCLVSGIDQLLIKSILSSQYNFYQYLRAFCASFFLRRLLIFPFGPHLKSLISAESLSIPSGRYAAFNFGQSCRIAYDDAGLNPIIRSFSEGKYMQTEKILYFNSLSRKKIKIESLDFFFPASFHDILDITIMRDLVDGLQKLKINVKIKEKELSFSVEPFDLIKFKIKSNYWQLHFFYPEVSNVPSDFSIKIVGRFISSRFVSWLLILMSKITTFTQALKQAKSAIGTSGVVRKVVMYNSLYFKIEFNSKSCLPICIKISGINLNYIDSKKNCEVYTIPDPWSNLQITCTVYQSLLLKGYVNSLFKSPEASYRFGAFLAGFMIPLQKVYQVFLSDPKSQWMATSVQEGFSFFLVYKRVCTLITIIRSSQTFQFILPHFGLSAILQFAIPVSKFERSKQKFNSAIQINISQLAEVKESIEEFFYERSLIENLEFGPPEYMAKQSSPAIRYNGPAYCQYVHCTLDENGIRVIVSDSAPKYLKNIINVPIEGRRNRCRFIRFIFNTLKLGAKGNDFLRTLSDITEMPGHLLNWQQSVENDESLNVNFNDKSISMNLTTKFGHFFLVVYPDNDSVTISSDQGFQIEKVSTMSNMKSWFKKFVSDETALSVDDNDNDHSYF